MLRAIMEQPLLYNMWSSLHFQPRFTAIKQEIRCDGRPHILDLGCGTGLFKAFYPECIYVGIDTNERYIDHAKKTLNGHFIRGDMLQLERYVGSRRFDYIIANGVLHHLDDSSITLLMGNVGAHLTPGGSIIVVDHVFREELGSINRILLRYDRGSFSRTEAEYRRLFHCFAIASYNEFPIKAGPLVMWIQCKYVLQHA